MTRKDIGIEEVRDSVRAAPESLNQAGYIATNAWNETRAGRGEFMSDDVFALTQKKLVLVQQLSHLVNQGHRLTDEAVTKVSQELDKVIIKLQRRKAG
jgi:hypothetical protein